MFFGCFDNPDCTKKHEEYVIAFNCENIPMARGLLHGLKEHITDRNTTPRLPQINTNKKISSRRIPKK